MEEIKRHGNYDLTYNQYGIDFLDNSDFFNKDDPNPYVDAFWEWWPTLKKDLKVFRITGGEPLMNPNTFKLLEMLENEPEPELQIHVNSNLGITHRLVQKMVEHVQRLLSKKAIKGFKLYTSIDTWGPQAEYIRTNLDIELWEKNLRYYLDNLPGQDISFMITFNVIHSDFFGFTGLMYGNFSYLLPHLYCPSNFAECYYGNFFYISLILFLYLVIQNVFLY
jgi:hypothetical protein